MNTCVEAGPVEVATTVCACATLLLVGPVGCGESSSPSSVKHSIDHEVVVLAASPLVITSQATVINPSTPLQVVGDRTWVCAVIKGDVPSETQARMDQVFNAAIGTSVMRMTLLLADGRRVGLHGPVQSWEKSGKILPHGELSYCGRVTEQIGRASVTSVEVSSDPPLAAHGLFFESTQSPSRPRQPIKR